MKKINPHKINLPRPRVRSNVHLANVRVANSLRLLAVSVAAAMLVSCSLGNPSPQVAQQPATPTGVLETLPTPTLEPQSTAAAGDIPTPVPVTAAPGEEWVSESYGSAWTIGYPGGWSVDSAGAHEGALQIEGTYQGRSYAVRYSYPIGILADSLQAWVEESLLPLTLQQREAVVISDITVANAPAQKVLNVPASNGESLAHHVYIWRSEDKNPRLITITTTDGEPSDAVAMDQLLDQLLATVQ
jgi:hypothetical protein